VLSFVAFWLAYKSKELAVMLPVLLLCYEVWFGKRRWKPLVPFFLVALSFGVQSMVLNANRNSDYTFRFTWDALRSTAPFYAGRIFLVPYLGFAVPLLLARNRRTWFGLAAMALFLFPMLFLPGRVFSAYCYLPLTGLAIALTGVAEATSAWAVVVFVLLMLPLDQRELRRNSRETLARGEEVRVWMGTVGRFASANPQVDTFVYVGAPRGFQGWGVAGAIKYFYKRGDLGIWPVGEAGAAAGRHAAVLRWDHWRRRLEIEY